MKIKSKRSVVLLRRQGNRVIRRYSCDIIIWFFDVIDTSQKKNKKIRKIET